MIWFPVAQAQSQSPVSLLQAYEAALRFDPVRQAASEALEVGREKSVRGDSLLKPRLMAPDRNRVAAVGLVLNVPLYAGGGLASREREALARQRQAEQELLAVRRDVRIQVLDAYVGMAMGAAKVGALEKAQAAAAAALDATTLARDVGARTALDVLDAQQYLHESQLKLVQGRCDHLLERIRLSLAVGDSGEAELRSINAALATDGR